MKANWFVCFVVVFSTLPLLVAAQSDPPGDPPILSSADILIAGADVANDAAAENPLIIRADKDGTIIWERFIPLQSWRDYWHLWASRDITEDAFYIITQAAVDQIDGFHRVLKFDKWGDLEWDVSVPLSTLGAFIAANPVNGGVYISGMEGICRLDRHGEILWGPENYGCSGFGYIVSSPLDGSAYAACTSNDRVLKIDKTGELLFDQYHPRPVHLNPNPINGGLYVGAYDYARDTTFYDSSFNVLWTKLAYPSYYTYGRAVSPHDGSIIIGSGWGHYLARVSMDGQVIFKVDTPTYNSHIEADIEEDNIYVCGDATIGVEKYDGYGNLLWRKKFGPDSWIGYYGYPGVYIGTPALNTESDIDEDYVPDSEDNCPALSNPDQTDFDSDGLGDVCDPCINDALNDIDFDGVCGDVDNCPNVSNPNQFDNDGDGSGDACDENDDCDSVPDIVDNCPFDYNPDQIDFDDDGAGDVCDKDDDSDGVLDADDQCLGTPTGEVVNSSGCGIGDLCPCEHPDGEIKWKNHGAYVSCVAYTSNSFLNEGLITEEEKDMIISVAAESDCGSKK